MSGREAFPYTSGIIEGGRIWSMDFPELGGKTYLPLLDWPQFTIGLPINADEQELLQSDLLPFCPRSPETHQLLKPECGL